MFARKGDVDSVERKKTHLPSRRNRGTEAPPAAQLISPGVLGLSMSYLLQLRGCALRHLSPVLQRKEGQEHCGW